MVKATKVPLGLSKVSGKLQGYHNLEAIKFSKLLLRCDHVMRYRGDLKIIVWR